jgi:F420H(2)-dependent quinone reductase
MARLARLRNRLTDLRWLSVRWTRLHVRLLRLSKGRLRFGFFLGGDMPVLALTTTGRRSGQRRSSVVAYLEDGGGYAAVASNAGSDRPPAWWLNLQADPECEIDVAGERIPARARVAEAGERDRLWRRFVEANSSYESYTRYTDRELPVVILERR